MGIGSITSTGSMPSMQITATDLKDQKSKRIQKEITDVQQQMQKLSSEGELSATEKENAKKELKREKSSLDTELKQHQEELLRSHKREIKLAGLQEARKPDQEENEEKAEGKTQSAESASNEKEEKKLPADEQQAAQPGTVITQSSDGTVILKEIMNQAESTDPDTENRPADEAGEEALAPTETAPADDDPAADARPSVKEIQAMVSADSSMQLADRLGTIVTKTNDGIAILTGEMKQDAYRDVDTERKQAELEKMQKQQQREMAFQFSLLGEAANAMQSATDTNASVKVDAEKAFQVSGLQMTPDEQAAQQGFQVAIA
ncbi:MAG: hypothetical protein K2M20_02625 [Lachnospiraceae bacterium]|nr:hypothetical protein [Lachnospiraceae bacterium]